MISLGGNTVDLVMARDATTAFLQEDPDGRFRFRVFERFAVREKDPTSVVRFEFRTREPTPETTRSTNREAAKHGEIPRGEALPCVLIKTACPCGSERRMLRPPRRDAEGSSVA